jgi:hypothetical protein
MPTGRVKWFDPDSGEARVVARSGREYPAVQSDVEPKARTADAHVNFKIKRDEGVARAVDVRLRQGTRVARSQHRFGDLSGAARPDSKGRPGLSRRRQDVGLDPDEPAAEVARLWVDPVVRGDRVAARRFYAPNCVIHTPGGAAETGRKAVEECLDRNPLLGSEHRDVRIRELGSRVEVRWPLTSDDQARVPVSEQRDRTTLRIAHGQIVEQWG